MSLVKLACSAGDFERAFRIVEESGDAAAAYHLAKFSEGPDAMRLYSIGGMYNHAIRFALSQSSGDCDNELMEIAQKCKSPQVFECAKYFEKKGMIENACVLYMRCGQKMSGRALSICLNVLDTNPNNKEMIDLLVSLASQLKGSLTKEVARRVVDKLDLIRQHELMVEVICSSNSIDLRDCLNMCVERNVVLTDEIADKILSVEETLDGKNRESKEAMQLIALKCDEQGNHRLACKMFTKCGERKMAMKCLLKTGDTKTIVSYANLCKSRDIFTLAGNHLQKL